jgi:hypothetical protein
MRFPIAAALALTAASSLDAQTAPATPDLATATPIAGDWTYTATNDGSEASFANSAGYPQLWVHCTRATRRVTIAKRASVAAPLLNVWTSGQSRNVASSFDAATGKLTINLDANDALLDGVANSRGRLGFTVGNEPPLVVPAWAEPARVVEDCRA